MILRAPSAFPSLVYAHAWSCEVTDSAETATGMSPESELRIMVTLPGKRKYIANSRKVGNCEVEQDMWLYFTAGVDSGFPHPREDPATSEPPRSSGAAIYI